MEVAHYKHRGKVRSIDGSPSIGQRGAFPAGVANFWVDESPSEWGIQGLCYGDVTPVEVKIPAKHFE